MLTTCSWNWCGRRRHQARRHQARRHRKRRLGGQARMTTLPPELAAAKARAASREGQPLRMSESARTGHPVPAEDLGRVHFLGIGGVGMSGLARIYVARGFPVSGSDVKENREVIALRALGA